MRLNAICALVPPGVDEAETAPENPSPIHETERRPMFARTEAADAVAGK